MKDIFLKLFLIAVLSLSIKINAFSQQPSNITGKITSADGQPAQNISVGLKGKAQITSTDIDGNYKLTKLKAGSYSLKITGVGIIGQEKNILLSEGETLEVNFVLNESSEVLKEVTISGMTNKYAIKDSEYISRMPLKNLENPQVYNTVGKEIMLQQLVTDYKQALRNIPGGGIAFGGANNGFAYTILRGFWTGVRLRNGVASESYSGIDPSIVERSEALKGPSGTLYGNSVASFGGLINLVTKQPFEERKTTVDYTLGSFDLNRLTVDLNTPLNADRTVLFRINAAQHSEGSFMDWGSTRRYVLAPSLFYKISKKFDILLNAEISKSQLSNLPLIDYTALGLRNITQLPIKYKQSTGSADPTFSGGGTHVFLKASYQLSAKWKSTTIAAMTSNSVDELVITRSIFKSPSIIERTTSSIPFTDNTYQLQQFFNGNFSIRGIENKFVLGLDLYTRKGVDNNYLGQQYTDSIDINKPYSPVLLEKIKMVRATLKKEYQISQTSVYAAYASNVTKITDQFSILLGLRVDRLDNKGVSVSRADFEGGYKQTAFSPKFGAVYQILKDELSAFASLTNSFENNAPVRQPNATIFRPKPTSGNQYECGIKTDLFENRLTATVSYFNVDISNAIRSSQQGFSFQDAKQTSKGFEIDLSASPIGGMNLTASYGHNKNVYHNLDANGKNVITRNYLPADYANFWITYKIADGAFKNLGMGAGTNYVGELNKYTTDPKTDAYFLTDGTLFYEGQKIRVGFKVNNIANNRIWGINSNPLASRNVAFSTRYTF